MSGRLNLMAPEFRANPYGFYAEMRRSPTLTQVDPGGLWVVSRYADVQNVLKNPQLFSCSGHEAIANPPWLGRSNPFAESIIMMDPPRHTHLRALVNRAFGPPVLARLEPRIRAYVEQITAELPAGSPVDFVEAFSLRVPIFVLGELLGVDGALRSRFKRWSDDIVAIGATPPDAHELHARIRASMDEMEQYLRGVLEERKRQPREDLVSDLLAANVDGPTLTESELMGFMILLFVAGLESTVNLLSNSARVLADHPDVLARLRADRSLIPQFVEEVLRYESPTHALLRRVTAETELSGVRLEPETTILLLIGSASRDEALHPNADRFNLDRSGQYNLSFGHGIHFCIGAPLVRLEARLAMEALLSRFSGMSLAGPAQWNQSLVARGPLVLPLTLRAA